MLLSQKDYINILNKIFKEGERLRLHESKKLKCPICNDASCKNRDCIKVKE